MVRRFVMAGVVLLSTALPLSAQDALAPERKQALSFSPVLALFEILQAEYERKVASNWTAVAGVGYWSFGDEVDGGEVSYLATDLKARFYPGDNALEGFSIGGIVGLTTFGYRNDTTLEDESETGLALGVDLNWSWLLGEQNRWFVGAGFGAKRLFFEVDDEEFSTVLPSGRIGFGFAF